MKCGTLIFCTNKETVLSDQPPLTPIALNGKIVISLNFRDEQLSLFSYTNILIIIVVIIRTFQPLHLLANFKHLLIQITFSEF